ncbi:hypothetical protein BV898_05025 [Hypsibius exemplaris]|uniref:Uncharacterized protein n=1 Tax=Hypsibius exemplaris TaxID=2072580 RepID=A0A1W0X0I6_HYPEX|nr:hypothetical protein BV898_05025 [Hypsibius exemplaris]
MSAWIPLTSSRAWLLSCLIIAVLVPIASTATKKNHCGFVCSESCEKLCGTPQFSRCCIGLMTKRNVIPEEQVHTQTTRPRTAHLRKTFMFSNG